MNGPRGRPHGRGYVNRVVLRIGEFRTARVPTTAIKKGTVLEGYPVPNVAKLTARRCLNSGAGVARAATIPRQSQITIFFHCIFF